MDTTHTTRHAWTGFIVVIVCALGSIARAAIPAVILGPDLQPRPVNLQGIGDGTVSYFAGDRVYRTESLNKLVAIREIGRKAGADKAGVSNDDVRATPIKGDEPRQKAPGPAGAAAGAANTGAGAGNAPAAGVLETIDGQRFPGTWAGASDDGQRVTWRHETMGDLAFALEKVRLIVWSGAAPDAPASTTDRLWLANGDSVEGFVAGVSAKGVDIRPANVERALLIPLERVKAMRLANAAPTTPPAGHLVWLADGTRVMSATIALADDKFAIEPTARATPGDGKAKPGDAKAGEAQPAAAIVIPAERVVRIDLSTTAGRLVPLGSLVTATVSGGDVLGLPTPPRVEGESAWLHAPVKMRFNLPEAAVRFTATARLELDEADPQRSKRWADMEVIVSIDDHELKRVRINDKTTQADIGVEAAGRSFTIEVTTGANGPVLDRLSLQGAAVLVRGKAE